MKSMLKSFTPVNITASLWFALMMIAMPASAAVIKTDIVMIVDESGSMGDVHSSIGYGISAFAAHLEAGGLDVQFALIGYGFTGDNIRLISDFVDAGVFASKIDELYTLGSAETAYDATAFALDGYEAETAGLAYREDAVKNLILFANEASNNDLFYNESTLNDLLQENSALFNVVLGAESEALETLANNNGGQVFDLDLLNTTNETQIDEFVSYFAEVKLNETIGYCDENPDDPACEGSESVSSPTGLSVLIVGLALVAFRRRSVEGSSSITACYTV